MRLLLTSYTASNRGLTIAICIIFNDLCHRRYDLSCQNFRRRKVRLDFHSKSLWVTSLSRRVYQQVDQRCTWVVTVSMCGDVCLNMLMEAIEVEAPESSMAYGGEVHKGRC